MSNRVRDSGVPGGTVASEGGAAAPTGAVTDVRADDGAVLGCVQAVSCRSGGVQPSIRDVDGCAFTPGVDVCCAIVGCYVDGVDSYSRAVLHVEGGVNAEKGGFEEVGRVSMFNNFTGCECHGAFVD